MIDAESRFSESTHRAGVAGAVLAAVLILLVLGLFGARQAKAAEIHTLDGEFASTGLSNPTAIAFDEESDSVYALDLFSGRLAKYTSAGAPSDFSALGTNNFIPPCGAACSTIAVDNSGGVNQGVIYIGSEMGFGGVRKVYNFLPSGKEGEGVHTQIGTSEQARFCGVATDSQEHLYIGHNSGVDIEQTNPDPIGSAYVHRFKPGKWLPTGVSPDPQAWPVTGTMYSMPQSNNSFQETCRIASSSDGDQYFSYYKSGPDFGGKVEGLFQLAPVARAPRDFFNILPGPPSVIVDEGSTGFAVDQATDDVYFVHGKEGDTRIVRRNEAGELLESFGSLVFSAGVAIDGDTGTVYVTDAFEAKIKVFTTTIGPDVTYSSPDVGVTGATVKATVGTAGAGDVTDCKVEYGPDDEYGSVEQCTPDAAGTPYSGDTPITAELTGLDKETTYHYRVSATNANGTSQGPDRTFTTHNVRSLSTDAPEAVTQTTATLKGSWVGDGTPTTYYFQYGASTSYSFTTTESAPDSTTGPVSVSEPISDLHPDTGENGLYHYRIVATNAEGTTFGPDRTFNTESPEPPSIEDTETGEVTATTAAVAAMVNPNLGQTFFQVEYGPTSAYGEHTLASDPIGEDGTFHAISETIAGLQPGTTYHYRVVATNFGGPTFGPDATFTTAAAPALPTPPAGPTPSSGVRSAAPDTSSGPTRTKAKKCKKRFVKRKGKCVKKKKKRKNKNRRSNGRG